ncbi:MAG: TolC family outer membrane protein [Serpentinimonas sp.]|nr:TolC family outer membrane protein [Serpentinimonas sp.]
MKTNRLTTIALAALLLSAGLASAQQLPAPMVEAARKAVVSNPEVQERWHAFRGSDALRDVARSGARPRVDLDAGVGREWQGRQGQPNTSFNRSSATLALNQMLFDGFFTRNEVARLDHAKLVRYYELLEISETAALEAVRAYADVARFSELVEEATANFVEHKVINDQIVERVGAGVSRRVDVEQATGRLALAESNLLTEVANLHDVSARYLRVVGEKAPATLPVIEEGVSIAPLPASPKDALTSGVPNNPAVNAAFENLKSAGFGIETAKAGYWPRVDFRVRQTWDRNLDGIRGNSTESAVEVIMNYNLYRGGADQARERQALEGNEEARALLEQACRNARQNISIAYNDVVRLKEQLVYLDQHRLSTEKVREAYRQQFDIGQRTLLDLLDTQNEYFEASRAYTNAKYDYLIAEARTLANMGMLTNALSVVREDLPSPSDAGQDRGPLDPAQLCPVDFPEAMAIDKVKLVADAPPRARAVAAAPAAAAARAAPAAAPERTTLSADTLFDFDRSVLKPEGRASLDALISRIRGMNVEVVVAVGHTDGLGSDAYNNRLSLARAESVKAYMVNQGIAANQIRTEGRGETQPVATNDTEEGRAMNRRVEIQVIEAKR